MVASTGDIAQMFHCGDDLKGVAALPACDDDTGGLRVIVPESKNVSGSWRCNVRHARYMLSEPQTLLPVLGMARLCAYGCLCVCVCLVFGSPSLAIYLSFRMPVCLAFDWQSKQCVEKHEFFCQTVFVLDKKKFLFVYLPFLFHFICRSVYLPISFPVYLSLSLPSLCVCALCVYVF